MIKYVLDTSVFVEAKKRYYGFAFCPGFWEWIDQQNIVGKVMSIENVLEEISEKDDELTKWSKARADRLFLPIDNSTRSKSKDVSRWVLDRRKEGFSRRSIERFTTKADYLIVTYAKVHVCIVVSEEVKVGPESKKVKIPNVCEHFEVDCIDTFQMLKREKVRFVLGN